MARKNIKPNSVARDSAQDADSAEVAAFKERVEQLREAGYVPMPVAEALGDAFNPNDPSWSGIINAHFSAGCCDPCNPSGQDMSRAIMSNGSEWHQVDAKGVTHDYISWGADNRTPNYISTWSKMLPYTATSLKHLNELAMGCCVQPKYRFFTVTRTKAETVTIDYDAAGDLIRRRLREVIQERHQMAHSSETSGNRNIDPADNNPSNARPSAPQPAPADPELIKLLDEEIAKLRKDLTVWEQTQKEVHEFVANNNLPLFYLKCMQELNLLGVTLPYIVLDKQGEVSASAQWKPKAIGIEHHPVAAFRLTRRDAQGRIRKVKMSNYWLTDRLYDDYKINIADLPMLDEQRPSIDLQERLNDWRISHRKASPDERPTRWVMPCIYPSDSNYYPYLAWWSIFEGDIFPYLATIISDRAIRKKNSNSVGRIVYIHTDYLAMVNKEKDAKKKLEMADKLRDEIFRETTKFLNDKKKNGSALLSFTFPDTRGNMSKAIEIVDVPYASKQQTDADTSELADIASIVFFALGVHPEIIGAIPGAAASKGGTYLREMLLIDEVTSASVLQQLTNRLFETIQAINGWDPEHLVWETPQKTLTTLDRNKSGVVEES